MFAQKPSIAEFIVSFKQLDSIALGQAQLIGASSCEVVCFAGITITKSAYRNSHQMSSKARAASAAADSGVIIITRGWLAKSGRCGQFPIGLGIHSSSQ